MLGNSKLVAFVATAKPEKAREFYERILGLALIEDSPFALVFEASGTQLRIQKVGAVSAPPYTALGWSVADIASSVRALASHGVACEKFPGLPQDETGVWRTPDGAKVAWFRDPDGNLLSLTEPA